MGCIRSVGIKKLFAIYIILHRVGKHINITMKPTNSPTQGQPNTRKPRLKVALGPRFFPQQGKFSLDKRGRVDCKQTPRARHTSCLQYIHGNISRTSFQKPPPSLCVCPQMVCRESGRKFQGYSPVMTRPATGRVRRFHNLTGRIGSDRIGSGRVGSFRSPDPTQPANFDSTLEKALHPRGMLCHVLHQK